MLSLSVFFRCVLHCSILLSCALSLIVLYYVCCISGVLCTFSHILSVVSLSSLMLLAFSYPSQTAFSVGINDFSCIDTIFDTSFSSILTILAKISTILNGPILGDIELPYESVGNHPAGRLSPAPHQYTRMVVCIILFHSSL